MSQDREKLLVQFAQAVAGLENVQPRPGVSRRRFEKRDDRADRLRLETGAGREVAALVLAALAEQQRHARRPELVELVHGAQHGQPPRRIGLGGRIDADRSEQSVQHLAVVEADAELVLRNAERLDHVGHQHAGFRVRRHALGADRIGIALHELAIAPRPGLLVAPDGAHRIAPISLGQLVEVFSHVAGERRRHVVAQAHPLLVLVLEREHAGIGPVLVGQKLAERIGVLDGRRLERRKAVALVDATDRRQHLVEAGEFGGLDITEALGRARFGSARSRGVWFGLGHMDWVRVAEGSATAPGKVSAAL